jgi:hypothetical protein
MNYSNTLLSGFAMMPTYVFFGIWLGTYSVWIWAIGMIIILYLCSWIYNSTVINAELTILNPGKTYAKLFLFQLIFYLIVVWGGIEAW